MDDPTNWPSNDGPSAEIDNFSGNFMNESNGNFTGHSGSPTPWWSQLVVQILYVTVCVVGLCGNTLVVYVVIRFSKMQTVTNLYIVNLAIADECFLVGIPFLVTTASLGYWPFGNIMCKAYFTSTSINQITSSMFLLIMSADRYIAVCHPIGAPKFRTPLIAKMVALTAWTISAIIMVPIFMYANTLEIDDKANCNIFWPESGPFHFNGETTFMLYSFLLGFAIPLTLISIFYIMVIRRLRTVGPKRRQQPPSKSIKSSGGNQSNESSALAQPPPRSDRKRSHRKVTKLVLTVITVYCICWLPFWTLQLILIFMPHEGPHSGTMVTLFLLAGCLSYSNSAMNPILYAFLSDNFKKSFLKACTCGDKKDINAALHIENSIFPRKRSEKGGKGGGNSIKGPSSSNRLQPNNIPPIIPKVNVDDEDDLESDDEGAAILGRSDINDSAMTSRSGMSESSKATQETFIQDGVHVTAL